jgi:hypothetical protein
MGTQREGQTVIWSAPLCTFINMMSQINKDLANSKGGLL